MNEEVRLIYDIMLHGGIIEYKTKHAQFYLDYLIARDRYVDFSDYRIKMVTKGMNKVNAQRS